MQNGTNTEKKEETSKINKEGRKKRHFNKFLCSVMRDPILIFLIILRINSPL
jgi:hypothetical protein